MSRGEDPEKNAALTPLIKEFARVIDQAEGKYLFGTDEPTLLDVMFLPILEAIQNWGDSCMANVLEDCRYSENGGVSIGKYLAKIKAHPLLVGRTQRLDATQEHWKRARLHTKGEKYQLNVDYMHA
jgi:hypothetical protein